YAALMRRSSTVARASVDRSNYRPSGAKARIEKHSYRSAEALRHPKALHRKGLAPPKAVPSKDGLDVAAKAAPFQGTHLRAIPSRTNSDFSGADVGVRVSMSRGSFPSSETMY
ncbi:MAG: hypothetical protein WA437_23095, partial [Candidatus Sulfotelmatobacter sp.]